MALTHTREAPRHLTLAAERKQVLLEQRMRVGGKCSTETGQGQNPVEVVAEGTSSPQKKASKAADEQGL